MFKTTIFNKYWVILFILSQCILGSSFVFCQKPQATSNKPLDLSPKAQKEISNVYTSPGDIPRFQIKKDGKTLELPLKHTHVKAELKGHVGQVNVTQTYHNAFGHPIEAVYVFPLPENSAVNQMKITIGKRVIEAKIKKRSQAQKIYKEAVQKGHTAALLEQERPNIFTQSIANIEPGATIDVSVSYIQNLTYDAGEYEFVFPMVVGPRFIPGKSSGQRSGWGWSEDTGDVPDASRITPLVLGAGHRSGHDISLELTADAGFKINSWNCITHQVVERRSPKGTLSIKLKNSDTLPNRDFVLKYHVDSQQPEATILTHKAKGNSRYFSLIVQPPRIDIDQKVGRREMIFVIDVSGSMHGRPLALCKEAMIQSLRKLRPVDTFNVITFESRTGKLFKNPRPANDTNIKDAMDFISGMRAGGGTMMGLGVKEALTPSEEKQRHRYVFFMTDGYIGNESTIMAEAHKLTKALNERGQKARVFTLGTGSSVNRHLLESIAKAGDGLAVYASNREHPAYAVNAYFRYIDHPILSDVKIDWGNAKVTDVYPKKIPDLFASHPIVIHGKMTGAKTGVLNISGTVGDVKNEITVNTNVESKNTKVIRTLWARAKIDWLEREIAYAGGNKELVDQITALGLDHHLVTHYTSLVAVDRSKIIKGSSQTIYQPIQVPEGVNAQMAGAISYRRSSGGELDDLLGSGIGFKSRKPRIKQGSRKLSKPIPSASANGGISRQTIHRNVKGAMPKLNQIFAEAVKKIEALEGKTRLTIVVKFTIGKNGKVTMAKVQGDKIPKEFAKKIESVFKRLRFPPHSKENMTITYPIKLEL